MTLPRKEPGAVDDQNTKIQRQTMLFLPFISIVYGGFLPAGLFIYWIVTTLFSIVQQYLIVGWGGLFPLLRAGPGLRPGSQAALPGRHAGRGDPTKRAANRCSPKPTNVRQKPRRRSVPVNGAADRADEGDDADMSAYQEFTGKSVEEALRRRLAKPSGSGSTTSTSRS